MSVTTKKSSGASRTRSRESYAIHALEDAMRVLEAISETRGEVRLSPLSDSLGLCKATVFRILATFEGLGYVEQLKDSGAYRPGLSAYAIGQKFLSGMGLLREARPVMGALAQELNEAVYCTVPVGSDVLFLDMVNTTQRVAIIPLLSKRYPQERVAAGQVIKAFVPPRGPKENRIGTQNNEVIRQLGACQDVDALGTGIASLAVPLFQDGGKVVGSLCVVAPEFRFNDEKIQTRILPDLKGAGQTVSARLGYLGNGYGSPR
ncbi:MAG: IclR family transcriptional regulator [Trichloromonadaceae bacterium]